MSPTTLRVEFGMANAEKQYDQNMKLQKLLGERTSAETVMTKLSMSSLNLSVNNLFRLNTSGSDDPLDSPTRRMYGSGSSVPRNQYSSGNTSPVRHNFPRRQATSSVLVLSPGNTSPCC